MKYLWSRVRLQSIIFHSIKFSRAIFNVHVSYYHAKRHFYLSFFVRKKLWSIKTMVNYLRVVRKNRVKQFYTRRKLNFCCVMNIWTSSNKDFEQIIKKKFVSSIHPPLSHIYANFFILLQSGSLNVLKLTTIINNDICGRNHLR